jgi:hypothetical protein
MRFSPAQPNHTGINEGKRDKEVYRVAFGIGYGVIPERPHRPAIAEEGHGSHEAVGANKHCHDVAMLAAFSSHPPKYSLALS